MVLVGPSGCGKTTALRMAAGLEEISGGVMRIGDRVVNHVPSRDRDIAMVFQSYALYPHLSVYENIAFGLKVKRLPKDEIVRRVENAARILDLEPFLKRKPRALSGGQRQRVAMGRAIVREPAAFLMDEPLSNLDAKLRVQMRGEIAELQRQLGVTTIYVTHDQVEAMTMGDRVAVDPCKGAPAGGEAPQALYDNPVNLFVGGYIGSPAMNLVEATLEQRGDGYAAIVGEQAIAIARETAAARPALAAYVGRPVVLGIRPEDLEDAELAANTPSDLRLRATTELTEALGSEIMAHFFHPGWARDDRRRARARAGRRRRPGEPHREDRHGSARGTVWRSFACAGGGRLRGCGGYPRAPLLRPGIGARNLQRNTYERSGIVKHRYTLGAFFVAIVFVFALAGTASGGSSKAGSAAAVVASPNTSVLGKRQLRRNLDRR